MKIIGGDFNAELGPGDGIELTSVGHFTLNKANCRGEWKTQWLLEKNLVALNTMYKKIPQKQMTYHTPKGGKKQLDYILTDKNTTTGAKTQRPTTTHGKRSLMCHGEVRDPRKKQRRNHVATKRPQLKSKEMQKTGELTDQTREDGLEPIYIDLEQEVKDAYPEKAQKTATKNSCSGGSNCSTDGSSRWRRHQKEECGSSRTNCSIRSTRKKTNMKRSCPHTRKEGDWEARKRTNP